MTKYPTFDDQQDKLEEPTMSYNVSSTHHMAVKPLPVQERIILTEEMKTFLHKAEKDLADGNCLTEEKFQARFAKWTSIHARPTMMTDCSKRSKTLHPES